MGNEDAKEFLKKLGKDNTLADKVKEAYRDAICKIGEEEGFRFSKSELSETAKELKEEGQSELSDDVLDNIAGGFIVVY